MPAFDASVSYQHLMPTFIISADYRRWLPVFNAGVGCEHLMQVLVTGAGYRRCLTMLVAHIDYPCWLSALAAGFYC
jgi:hypothetical protein